MITGHGFPQIVRPVGIVRLVSLLRLVAHACEIAIEQTCCNAVAEDGFHGWRADEHFATTAIGCPYDGARRHFRLKDRRNRLRAIREATLDPVELRRIERR